MNPYASPHHRVSVRSASNVAHNNGYTQSNQMLYSNPYGNSSNNMKTNYFWTCTACFQMVDPALTSCQICGTVRDPLPQRMQQQYPSYHQQHNKNIYDSSSNYQ